MQTPEFEAAIKALIEAAKREQITIMCAEAVPWRCHRSLVGDALKARGIAIKDFMSATRTQPHELTSFAKVKGTPSHIRLQIDRRFRDTGPTVYFLVRARYAA
jgi:uncharacterized protein (DUF488 family)